MSASIGERQFKSAKNIPVDQLHDFLCQKGVIGLLHAYQETILQYCKAEITLDYVSPFSKLIIVYLDDADEIKLVKRFTNVISKTGLGPEQHTTFFKHINNKEFNEEAFKEFLTHSYSDHGSQFRLHYAIQFLYEQQTNGRCAPFADLYDIDFPEDFFDDKPLEENEENSGKDNESFTLIVAPWKEGKSIRKIRAGSRLNIIATMLGFGNAAFTPAVGATLLILLAAGVLSNPIIIIASIALLLAATVGATATALLTIRKLFLAEKDNHRYKPRNILKAIITSANLGAFMAAACFGIIMPIFLATGIMTGSTLLWVAIPLVVLPLLPILSVPILKVFDFVCRILYRRAKKAYSSHKVKGKSRHEYDSIETATFSGTTTTEILECLQELFQVSEFTTSQKFRLFAIKQAVKADQTLPKWTETCREKYQKGDYDSVQEYWDANWQQAAHEYLQKQSTDHKNETSETDEDTPLLSETVFS